MSEGIIVYGLVGAALGILSAVAEHWEEPKLGPMLALAMLTALLWPLAIAITVVVAITKRNA